MRQRKAKNLDERLYQCRELIIAEEEIKSSDFVNKPDGGIFLEIGCGKGQFILKKALDNPSNNYLGIEGQETVMLRALEKAMAISGKEVVNDKIDSQIKGISAATIDGEGKPNINNLKFTCAFVSEMDKLVKKNQLDGIYLNFSDPWPKARHAKRRLTYHERLEDYARHIKPGGFIEIKTDNEGLFEFTLEEIELVPLLETVEMTRDLHSESCEYEAKKTKTEYEDKFSGIGKNINYVKVKVNA